MNKVEIYSKRWCPYCSRAKTLLDSAGVQYAEYDVSSDATREHEMRLRSQRHTVPQVFVNNQHIGGSDDLMDAYHSGRLQALLEAQDTATSACKVK